LSTVKQTFQQARKEEHDVMECVRRNRSQDPENRRLLRRTGKQPRKRCTTPQTRRQA
jgi:hypothetical protein